MAEVALKFLNLDERQGLKEFRAIQRFKTIRYPHLASVTAFWLLDETGKVLDDIGDVPTIRRRRRGATPCGLTPSSIPTMCRIGWSWPHCCAIRI